MVFAPVPSVLFVLLMFVVPAIAVIATICCAIAAAHARWVIGGGRWWPTRVGHKGWAAFGLLLLCDAWAVFVFVEMLQIDADVNREARNKAARAEFVLAHDFHHGELVFPAGTHIQRYDPFDNGENERPLSLTGLKQARFPRAVDILGVAASALAFNPGISADIELAHDQTVNGVACRLGQWASYSIPFARDDTINSMDMLLREPIDGPDADFKPSQWQFRECRDAQQAIRVKPLAPS